MSMAPARWRWRRRSGYPMVRPAGFAGEGAGVCVALRTLRVGRCCARRRCGGNRAIPCLPLVAIGLRLSEISLVRFRTNPVARAARSAAVTRAGAHVWDGLPDGSSSRKKRKTCNIVQLALLPRSPSAGMFADGPEEGSDCLKSSSITWFSAIKAYATSCCEPSVIAVVGSVGCRLRCLRDDETATCQVAPAALLQDAQPWMIGCCPARPRPQRQAHFVTQQRSATGLHGVPPHLRP
jgi:hypothetical protein